MDALSENHAFPDDELSARLANVRSAMAETRLDGLIVSAPENIYLSFLKTGSGYRAARTDRDGE